MEKESNNMLAFPDIYVSNKDPCNLLTSFYRKKTFTGLLTNFYSFTSYSYKISLIRTLVYRTYKINNTLPKFNDDVRKLFDIFKKNQYPGDLINRVVYSYLDSVHSSNNSKSAIDISALCFTLPFLKLSNFTHRKVRMLAKKYCKNLNIKFVFSSFKIKNFTSYSYKIGLIQNSNIFKHLKSSDKCKKACNDSCFTILDSASTYH